MADHVRLPATLSYTSAQLLMAGIEVSLDRIADHEAPDVYLRTLGAEVDNLRAWCQLSTNDYEEIWLPELDRLDDRIIELLESLPAPE